MKTELINVTNENINEAAAAAAELLSAGQLVAIPTETVYGLAASIEFEDAIRNIYEVKGRPQDNPIIVHISSIDMLLNVAEFVPSEAFMLADAFWPGPLTIILKKSKYVNDVITCGMDTVAVRYPSHPVAAAVIEAAGVPLAAPSANLSGKPSPTTAAHCMHDLDGKIPLILNGGSCDVGVESTVISLAGDRPTVLRPGIISLEELQAVLPDTVLSEAVLREVAEGEKVESPGLKYKHYSPDCDVILVNGTLGEFAAFVAVQAGPRDFAMCFDGEESSLTVPCIPYGTENDPRSLAHNIFAVLRELDQIGARRVYVRAPKADGKSMAVSNRLIRAAGFKVIEL